MFQSPQGGSETTPDHGHPPPVLTFQSPQGGSETRVDQQRRRTDAVFQSPQGGSETGTALRRRNKDAEFQSPQGGSETVVAWGPHGVGRIGFNPLKAGRKLACSTHKIFRAAVSIPSRRVGNREAWTFLPFLTPVSIPSRRVGNKRCKM